MKFFFGILLVTLVAFATAEETTTRPVLSNLPKLTETETEERNIRNKRDFLLGTYYPSVAAPITYTAPLAYTYSAASLTPYSYTAYRTFAPYYTYPLYY